MSGKDKRSNKKRKDVSRNLQEVGDMLKLFIDTDIKKNRSWAENPKKSFHVYIKISAVVNDYEVVTTFIVARHLNCAYKKKEMPQN